MCRSSVVENISLLPRVISVRLRDSASSGTFRGSLARRSRLALASSMVAGTPRRSTRSVRATRKTGDVKTPPAKAKVASTLLEVTETADSDTRTATKRSPRSMDSKIGKILSDNFKGWPQEAFDSKVDPATGKTLRERIRADKIDGTTMGKLYYSSLKKIYEPQDSPAKLLRATNPDDTVDERLDQAIVSYCSHPSKPQYIKEYFRGDECPNLLCVVAAMRFLLDVPMATGMHHLATAMDGFKWMVRVGVPAAYPEQVEAIRPHIDQVLLRSWQVYKGKGIATKAWWLLVRGFASMVVDTKRFEDLVWQEKTENNSWLPFEKSLQAVVAESRTGSMIFKGAAKAIEACRVLAIVEGCLKELKKQKSISADTVKEAKTAFAKKVEELGASPTEVWQRSREVSITYRGISIKVVVSSHMEHWHMQIMSYLKGTAVASEHLPSLFAEDKLVAEQTATDVAVADGLLEAAMVARSAAQESAVELEQATGDDVVKVLRSQHAVLLSMDPTWEIELAFFVSLSGENGQKQYHNRILSCLPTAAKGMDLKTSLNRLKALRSSEMSTYCGRGLVNQLNTIIDWVTTASQSRMVKLGSGDTPLLKAAGQQMANFVRETTGADNKKVVVGAEAAKLMLKRLQEKASNNEAITLDMCKTLQVFKYLLKENEVKVLDGFAEKTLARPVSQLPSSSSSEPPAKKKAAADRKEQSKQMMSRYYFKLN